VRGARAGIVVLLAAAFAGCGSGGSRTGLTGAQRSALIAQLEAVRTHASAHEVAATTAALRRFRRSVASLTRAGALTAGDARELRVGASRLLTRVKQDAVPVPPPQPTVSQTTLTPAPAGPAPAPGPPGKHKGEKKHDKPGKGGGDAQGGGDNGGGD